MAIFPHSLLLLLLLLTTTLSSTHSSPPHHHRTSLDDACRATKYRSFCMQSLSPLSRRPTARRTALTWARLGVSVGLTETGRVASKLASIADPAEASAVSGCTQGYRLAMMQLRQSADELRQLHVGKGDPRGPIENVRTWLTGVMANLDDCDNELELSKEPVVEEVRRWVPDATYATYNAYDLVYELAAEAGMH